MRHHKVNQTIGIDYVRLSAGIESIGDTLADLEQALARFSRELGLGLGSFPLV